VDAMKNIISMCLVICCGLYAATSHATLATYNDRSVFNLQGSIVYNYGFEDFTGSPYFFPGTPYTSHGVTYTSPGKNLIFGPNTTFGITSNILLTNNWTPLTATISPAFNMFGFDIGLFSNIENDGPVDFLLTTNLGTYDINGLDIEETFEGLDFLGFVAGYNEYFTNIRIDSTNVSGSGPVLDNVTLGNRSDQGFPPSSGPVPEPSTFLLLSAGLIGVGFLRKRMRK
jgi:hypothetical protein